MKDARQVFDEMVLQRNAITWNVMIGAYAQNGHGGEAFEVLLTMQETGLQPDAATYLNILHTCDTPVDLRCVQSQVASAGLESDLRVGTALFNIYMEMAERAAK
jgi:pentatricopeptide repeat protein